MAATIITDLIVPEMLRTEANVEFATLFDFTFAGAAQRIPVDAGEFVKIRGFNDLTGDADRMVNNGSYDTNKIDAYADIGVVLHKIKKFGAEDLAEIVTGMDASAQIRSLIARFFLREVTNRFINVLTANFATGGPLHSTNLHDIYVDTATESDRKKLDPDAAAVGLALVDPSTFNGGGVWFMHKAVKAYLAGQKHIVGTVNQSAFGGPAGQVDTYLGSPIMVAAHADMVTAGTNCSKYRTYYLAPGSLALGVQKDINPEISRTSDKIEIVSTDMHFAAHLRGCKWNVVTTNPTNAVLATAASWALAYADAAYVRAVAFDTNIA